MHLWYLMEHVIRCSSCSLGAKKSQAITSIIDGPSLCGNFYFMLLIYSNHLHVWN